MLYQTDQIKTEHLGHLGLVASTISDLNLVNKINDRLPLNYKKGGKISHGHRSAAMILNGLGYLTRTLYLSSHFFENKPMDLLLGIDCQSDDFNDDMLGRHLDAIAEYGTTKLFSELCFEIASEHNLLGQSYHLDTTNFSLYGDYEDYSDASPQPHQGYSKDHRPDLKQVTLSLTQLSGSNMPLWFECLDGNSSDKKNFQETVRAIECFQKSIENAPDNLFFIVDSAFYTPEQLAKLSQVKWITRVPATNKEAKMLLNKHSDEIDWYDAGKGYRLHCVENNYHDISQRWVLVSSEQARKRALKTFHKKINKEFEQYQNSFWHLSNQEFACEKDAIKAIKSLSKKMKYHFIEFNIQPKPKYSGKGRPKKGEPATGVGYYIEFSLACDCNKVNQETEKLGRFILATNELDKTLLSDHNILSEYKSQSNIETGFGFLKSDEFCLNHIFLKNPKRIGALMMMMTLCLVVYNFAQFKLRETLENDDVVVPNQLGKPIKNPTLRWIFQLMCKISVVCVWNEQTQTWYKKICNMKTIHNVIITQFGVNAKRIYGIPILQSLPEYDRSKKPLHLWTH